MPEAENTASSLFLAGWRGRRDPRDRFLAKRDCGRRPRRIYYDTDGFAESQQEGDWVGEFGGVKVFVDPQSAPVLQGVEVDWVETLQATGFAIRNPNAVRSCGCGKSFETH